MEPPVSHQDVTTIMRFLGDINEDAHEIRRRLLEDDDGDEEVPEADS